MFYECGSHQVSLETVQGCRSRSVHLHISKCKGWITKSRREQATKPTWELEEQVSGEWVIALPWHALSEEMVVSRIKANARIVSSP